MGCLTIVIPGCPGRRRNAAIVFGYDRDRLKAPGWSAIPSDGGLPLAASMSYFDNTAA